MFRELWQRIWLRRAKFSSRYSDLQRLYALSDPWDLSASHEQERFRRTNELILELAPHCRTLLELGSGEGHQTEHLVQVSQEVVGLELSSAAVKRATARLPQVDFRVGTAEQVEVLFAGKRFDLATACEVLYYIKDIPAAIRAVQNVADALLVTSYSERAERMAVNFTGPGWSTLQPIHAGDTTWLCHLWRRVPSISDPPDGSDPNRDRPW